MSIKIYYKCIKCKADCYYWTIDGKRKVHTCQVCGTENPYKVLGFSTDRPVTEVRM